MQTRRQARQEIEAQHEAERPAGRGQDEVDFLGSRAHSTPEKPATIRATLAQLVDQVRRAKRTEGIEAHAHGTTLNTLYMRHADAVLGFPSFKAFLVASWPEDVGEAYRAMRIAKLCTAEQATAGVTRCDLGIRLMRRLSVESFGKLVDPKRPFMLHLPDDAKVSFADATVRQLRAALALLETPGATSADDEQEQLQRTRREIAALVEVSPEYLELYPTASLQDGEVEVRLRARGKGGRRTALKFLNQLRTLR